MPTRPAPDGYVWLTDAARTLDRDASRMRCFVVQGTIPGVRVDGGWAVAAPVIEVLGRAERPPGRPTLRAEREMVRRALAVPGERTSAIPGGPTVPMPAAGPPSDVKRDARSITRDADPPRDASTTGAARRDGLPRLLGDYVHGVLTQLNLSARRALGRSVAARLALAPPAVAEAGLARLPATALHGPLVMWWQSELRRRPSSEADLFGPADGKLARLELMVCHAALLRLGATPLRDVLGAVMRGWWGMNLDALPELAAVVAAAAPATDREVLELAGGRNAWPSAKPLLEHLDGPGSTVTRGGDGVWTRRDPLRCIRERLVATIGERSMYVLDARTGGTRGAAVAAELGISKARVGMLEADARQDLHHLVRRSFPLLLETVRVRLDHPAVPVGLLAQDVFETADPGDPLLVAVIAILGGHRVRGFDGKAVDGWWSADGDRLRTIIRDRLAPEVPFDDEVIEAFAQANQFDATVVRTLLGGAASPLVRHAAGCWVRRGDATRDAVVGVLRRSGHPIDRHELAAIVGLTRGDLQYHVARDGRLVSTRHGRTVALVGWDLDRASSAPRGVLRYRSVLDAVVDVLETTPRLTMEDLADAVVERYGVQRDTVRHYVTHEHIGRWPDGRIGLVAKGAVHREEPEPRRPAWLHVASAGRVVTFDVRVTPAMLRRLTPPVPRWVGWAAGVRSAPQTRSFARDDGGVLVLRRACSNTYASGVPAVVEALGLTTGCTLSVRLDLAAGTARLRAACACHRTTRR